MTRLLSPEVSWHAVEYFSRAATDSRRPASSRAIARPTMPPPPMIQTSNIRQTSLGKVRKDSIDTKLPKPGHLGRLIDCPDMDSELCFAGRCNELRGHDVLSRMNGCSSEFPR